MSVYVYLNPFTIKARLLIVNFSYDIWVQNLVLVYIIVSNFVYLQFIAFTTIYIVSAYSKLKIHCCSNKSSWSTKCSAQQVATEYPQQRLKFMTENMTSKWFATGLHNGKVFQCLKKPHHSCCVWRREVRLWSYSSTTQFYSCSGDCIYYLDSCRVLSCYYSEWLTNLNDYS